MAGASPKTITDLCEGWLTAWKQPDGSRNLIKAQDFRLCANGIKFHELGHDSICAAIIGLTKVLSDTGLNTVISHDHYALWGWCGEVLNRHRGFKDDVERQTEALFTAVLRAALCQRLSTKLPPDQFDLSEFGVQSHIVLAYLAFPLLEAVLRRACSQYIQIDGTVLQDFDGYKAGKRRCSNVGDLLKLHHESVASADLKVGLDFFRSHIQMLDGSSDPYEVIFKWRNGSLHGETMYSTIGGTILNLILWILMADLGDEYEGLRAKALESSQREALSGYRSQRSFYLLD